MESADPHAGNQLFKKWIASVHRILKHGVTSKSAMNETSAKLRDLLWQDPLRRERYLRQVITDRLATRPAPVIEGFITATYFFAFRTLKLAEAVEEISYHAT